MHAAIQRFKKIDQPSLKALYEGARGNPVELGEITRSVMEAIYNTGKEGYSGPQLRPEEVSLRRIWEATIGPAEQSLGGGGGPLVLRQAMDAIDETAFPMITGALIASVVIPAYEGAALIADQLTTNMPSKRRIENIVGFEAAETLKTVHPGHEYEYSGLEEKYFTSEAVKRGRLIAITEEMVIQDQTGQIVVRARRIGERGGQDKEKQVIGCIYDAAGYAGYNPAGVPTALWGATNTIMNNALVDYTDVEAARAMLAQQVDEQGEPIVIRGANILVAEAERTAANIIAKSVQTWTNIAAAAPAQVYPGTPVAIENVYSSPYMDWLRNEDATLDTCWFFGDFKGQFFWHEVIPIQVLARTGDSDNKWNRDIPVEFKVRHMGACAATDNRRVIMSCEEEEQ